MIQLGKRVMDCNFKRTYLEKLELYSKRCKRNRKKSGIKEIVKLFPSNYVQCLAPVLILMNIKIQSPVKTLGLQFVN